jgi:hypothetical protein
MELTQTKKKREDKSLTQSFEEIYKMCVVVSKSVLHWQKHQLAGSLLCPLACKQNTQFHYKPT